METITVKNSTGCPETMADILVRAKIDFSPKVSVIIPVYNAAKYLPKCLDSVLQQSLKEIEIICVNDGSADDSLSILTAYAQKDPRITVISQKNLHAGVARNAGLSIAAGDYLGFLDADDWMTPQGLASVYNVAAEYRPDMIKFASTCWDNERQEEIYDKWFTLENFPADFFGKNLTFYKEKTLLKLPDSPWSGLYKKDFIEHHAIRFDNALCANDVSFFIRCLLKATKIQLAAVRVVFYRVNNPSSLIGNRKKNFDCMYQNYEIIVRSMTKVPPKFKRLIQGHLIAGIIDRFNRYFLQDDEQIQTEQFAKIKSFLIKQRHVKFSDKLKTKITKIINADTAQHYFSILKLKDPVNLLCKKEYFWSRFRALTQKIYSAKTVWKLFR